MKGEVEPYPTQGILRNLKTNMEYLWVEQAFSPADMTA